MSDQRARLRQAFAADIAAMFVVRYAVRENTLTPGRISDEDVRAAIEDKGRGWVIETDAGIVGFAIGDARDGNVWALFVHPDHEGRGYGGRLHDAMVEWLWSQGLERLWLETGRGTRAQGFYERRGWRAVAAAEHDQLRYELDRDTAANEMWVDAPTRADASPPKNRA